MKNQILLFLSSLVCMVGYSQLGGGVKVGYDMYLNDSKVRTFSVGVVGTKALDDQLLFRIGFQYGLPTTHAVTYTAEARSSQTIPTSINVNADVFIETYHLNGDAVKFFGKSSHANGGIYGVLGIGLTYTIEQVSFENFNPCRDLHRVKNIESEQRQEYLRRMLRGFVGYDIALKSGHFFCETGISLGGLVLSIDQRRKRQFSTFLEVAAGVRF